MNKSAKISKKDICFNKYSKNKNKKGLKRTMEKKFFTEQMRNNKTAMLAHMIDVTVMTIFCILQALGNFQPWSYLLFW